MFTTHKEMAANANGRWWLDDDGIKYRAANIEQGGFELFEEDDLRWVDGSSYGMSTNLRHMEYYTAHNAKIITPSDALWLMGIGECIAVDGVFRLSGGCIQAWYQRSGDWRNDNLCDLRNAIHWPDPMTLK